MTHSCEKYLRKGPKAEVGEGEGESGADKILNAFDLWVGVQELGNV